MAPRGALSVLAAMLAAAVCPGAFADDAGEYTFTVLKDGEPVGHHRFAFECQGDRIEIKEATTIQVRLATIPIYAFEHRAHQIWENGRAVRIDATTNDNGQKLDITVRPGGEGYIRTVNGRVDTFDGSTAVLAFWNKDILRHQAFFSVVEDKVLDATFRFVGQEEIALSGGRLETNHYRMVGDEERDLWFDRRPGRQGRVPAPRLTARIHARPDQHGRMRGGLHHDLLIRSTCCRATGKHLAGAIPVRPPLSVSTKFPVAGNLRAVPDLSRRVPPA